MHTKPALPAPSSGKTANVVVGIKISPTRQNQREVPDEVWNGLITLLGTYSCFQTANCNTMDKLNALGRAVFMDMLNSIIDFKAKQWQPTERRVLKGRRAASEMSAVRAPALYTASMLGCFMFSAASDGNII